MPADELIRVIFKRVYVRNDADTFGSGEFYFTATVAGEDVIDPSRRPHIYNAVEHHVIPLPEAQWHKDVNVRNRREVEVVFVGRDKDVIVDDDLGRISCTLRLPFTQQRYCWRHRTRYFMLDWEVQLSVGGRFGRHPARAVFSCRENPGSVSCTTVSGRHFRSRGEIHPTQPVPTPPPAAQTPARPRGIVGGSWTDGASVTVTANSPMNILPNPAVIPVLDPPGSAEEVELLALGPPDPSALDYATWANRRNCAKIHFTYYRPDTLRFQPNDRRLEWRAVTVSGGGTVAFLGDPIGREVLVYGTHEGEVRLEVRFQGALFATYRALVKEVQPITCRFNILNGPTAGSQPRSNPDDVKNHFEIANRFIRQLGIQLRLDTDSTTRHGARTTNHPGIFRIRVPRGRTRRVPDTGFAWACRRNARYLTGGGSILNFAYIHSDSGGNLGSADSYPANNEGNSISDPPDGVPATDATPSTSWVQPSGVAPSGTATRQTMALIGERLHRSFRNLRAMCVTDACGGTPGTTGGVPNHRTAHAQMLFAGTIAHELGHMLNLGHRVEGVPETSPGAGDQRSMTAADPAASLVAGGHWWDTMLHPYDENVMNWWNESEVAQDFDIIQARAVHESPMVPTL